MTNKAEDVMVNRLFHEWWMHGGSAEYAAALNDNKGIFGALELAFTEG